MPWSAELQALTRDTIDNLDVLGPPDGKAAFKHLDGRFGTIDVADLVAGRLTLVERRTGQIATFTDADELVRAGWVLD